MGSTSPRLGRKTLRIVQYRGHGRTETQRENEFSEGYAVIFDAAVDYVMTVTPANEVIEQALRREIPMFPRIAVRELLANALIHQDFSVTGAGPMVSIFDKRIEISNPGEPLVPTDRFVDAEPISRNERLARLMRRFNICEERGSGIDKVIQDVELFQLPPPLFQVPPGSTRTALFAHKPLPDMDKSERIRACYLHACLCYVMNRPMNNASIRERFGLPNKLNDRASRLLREAVDDGTIVVRDPSLGTRSWTYLPFWAA
jgi:predicted HTH transcriptional regulator